MASLYQTLFIKPKSMNYYYIYTCNFITYARMNQRSSPAHTHTHHHGKEASYDTQLWMKSPTRVETLVTQLDVVHPQCQTAADSA